MKVKNLSGVDSFLRRRADGTDNYWDRQWISTNRARVVGAALSLYRRLNPNDTKSAEEILGSVQTWAFQQERFDGDFDIVDEDSIFLNRDNIHRQVSRRRGTAYAVMNFSEDEMISCPIENGHTNVNRAIFEGNISIGSPIIESYTAVC